jgi:uncharacterized protein YndB with AHSA1/START domain
MAVDRGALVIGDISGYTGYLTGVELEHSHDVIADLLDTMVRAAEGTLTLSKLEGDAILWYRIGVGDGIALLAAIEAVYAAFRRRVRTIVHQTTCTCNACRQIPDLDLKVVAHAGEFVVREIAGTKELVGGDVIVVHRLLKNHVIEEHGVPAYAFITDALLRDAGISIDGERHMEHYDDVGDVPGRVIDLEQWLAEGHPTRDAYIAPTDAAVTLEYDLRTPPGVLWEYLTDPRKRMLWTAGVKRIDRDDPDSPLGAGSTNHCVHGAGATREEILDWAPYDSYTWTSTSPLGVMRMTCELRPQADGGGTHVSWRIAPQTARAKLALRFVASNFRRSIGAGMQTIERLAAAPPVSGAGPG